MPIKPQAPPVPQASVMGSIHDEDLGVIAAHAHGVIAVERTSIFPARQEPAHRFDIPGFHAPPFGRSSTRASAKHRGNTSASTVGQRLRMSRSHRSLRNVTPNLVGGTDADADQLEEPPNGRLEIAVQTTNPVPHTTTRSGALSMTRRKLAPNTALLGSTAPPLNPAAPVTSVMAIPWIAHRRARLTPSHRNAQQGARVEAGLLSKDLRPP